MDDQNGMRCLFVTTLFLFTGGVHAKPATCTYTTYSWNTVDKVAVEYRTVSKPYDTLLDEEKDAATGCSVCEEDQQEIQLSGIKSFKVCRLLADAFRRGLEQAISDGQLVRDVVGYRVGKTRGDIDSKGNRTRFSNHSYGVAIDVNTDFNGLYDHCFVFGKNCRLIKGGPWLPEQPESIRPESPVVTHMKAIGFQWGGQIQGNQKDFMHFSPTGY